MCKIKITLACMALVALFTKLVVLHGIVILLLIVLCYRRVAELKNIGFWLIFVATSFLPYVVFRNSESLNLSLLIFSRSFVLYLALLTIAENIDLNLVNKWLPKLIGTRLSLALSLAFNLVPIIRHILIKNYALFYFRKTSGRTKIKFLFGYVFAVLRQVINAADGCAENMLLTHQALTPKIYFITGARHSGKTTLLSQIVADYKTKSWPITGVLAPSLLENNRRSTIFVQNVKTEEKKLLASRNLKITDSEYEYGGFNFSAGGLQFAKSALLDFYPKGIVILDELGPLELAGLGYAKEFAVLLKSDVAAIFIVIREELVQRFIEQFSLSPYEVIAVESQRNVREDFKNPPVHQSI